MSFTIVSLQFPFKCKNIAYPMIFQENVIYVRALYSSSVLVTMAWMCSLQSRILLNVIVLVLKMGGQMWVQLLIILIWFTLIWFLYNSCVLKWLFFLSLVSLRLLLSVNLLSLVLLTYRLRQKLLAQSYVFNKTKGKRSTFKVARVMKVTKGSNQAATHHNWIC